MRVAVVAIIMVGCIDSSSVQCPSGALCAAGTKCAAVVVDGAPVDFCVNDAQLTECMGQLDATGCPVGATPGSCHDGVCLPIACRNHLVDLGEVCDDGNTLAADCCSSDCR